MNRREFSLRTATVGSAFGLAATAFAQNEPAPPARRIRVGVIGCGSVSTQYLPHLARSPFVELVSACDIIPERVRNQAERHRIPNSYPNIDRMLAGAAFDLFVNLTDMQEHERLNRQAIQAGKHVWSEKPLANSYAAGQQLLALAAERQVRVWGAPTVVNSPQFGFMARTIASRSLGKIAAARADYGHTGPDWSAFFYEEGGGSLPDLGVYSLTTLTGLLGPARAVTAMTISHLQGRQQLDNLECPFSTSKFPRATVIAFGPLNGGATPKPRVASNASAPWGAAKKYL